MESTLPLIIAAILAAVAIGILAFLVVGIHRDDRTNHLTHPAKSLLEATTRRLLGVGVRTPESDASGQEVR